MTPQPFPWGRAMAFGFGVLKLSPAQFWTMTPREFAAALEGASGRAPALDRAAFDKLMTRYPDDRQADKRRA